MAARRAGIPRGGAGTAVFRGRREQLTGAFASKILVSVSPSARYQRVESWLRFPAAPRRPCSRWGGGHGNPKAATDTARPWIEQAFRHERGRAARHRGERPSRLWIDLPRGRIRPAGVGARPGDGRAARRDRAGKRLDPRPAGAALAPRHLDRNPPPPAPDRRVRSFINQPPQTDHPNRQPRSIFRSTAVSGSRHIITFTI